MYLHSSHTSKNKNVKLSATFVAAVQPLQQTFVRHQHVITFGHWHHTPRTTFQRSVELAALKTMFVPKQRAGVLDEVAAIYTMKHSHITSN
jgi:hypothetical protein